MRKASYIQSQSTVIQILWVTNSLIILLLFNSKMNLGRHQLLEWINKVMQTQYTSVEMLSDGVGYAQVIDAIHPGSINIHRLNLNTKYPEDHLRNIRLIEEAIKKLKITQPIAFQKVSKGKFHDNIIFLQWLYHYSNKYGKQNLQYYTAFEKRLLILEKQGKEHNQMNLHLLPNQAYLQQKEWQVGAQSEQIRPKDQHNNERQAQVKIQRVGEYVRGLQCDLKEKMQLNWRMMHLVDKSIEQRNILYSLLSKIDRLVEDNPNSLLKVKLQQILHHNPYE